MNRERYVWIDTARAIAIFFVIIGHMNVGKMELTWIYSFHMPIFYMISGCTYALSNRNRKLSAGQFIKKKAKSLLVPYFAFSLLLIPVWWLNFKILGNSSSAFRDLLFGMLYSNEDVRTNSTNAAWFLTNLFLAEVLFFLLEKFSHYDYKKFVLWILLIGSCGFLIADHWGAKIKCPWHVNVLPVALVFMCLGFLFIRNLPAILDFCNAGNRLVYWFLAGIFFILGSVAGIWNGKVSVHASLYNDTLLFLISSTFISFAIALFSMRLPYCRFISFVGKNTVTIMAVHAPILRFLEHYSAGTIAFAHGYPHATGIIILGLSTVIAWMIRRFFPFFLGAKTQAVSFEAADDSGSKR